MDPTGPVQTFTYTISAFWYDPATGLSGFGTFNVTTASVPVDIHFASFHGRGTLSFTSSTCVAGQCPPPGAFVFGLPSGSSMTGFVGSPQDGGSLYMNGPGPTIR